MTSRRSTLTKSDGGSTIPTKRTTLVSVAETSATGLDYIMLVSTMIEPYPLPSSLATICQLSQTIIANHFTPAPKYRRNDMVDIF
jgi:hypothetical protein